MGKKKQYKKKKQQKENEHPIVNNGICIRTTSPDVDYFEDNDVAGEEATLNLIFWEWFLKKSEIIELIFHIGIRRMAKQLSPLKSSLQGNA